MGSNSPINLDTGNHDAMIRRLRGNHHLQKLASFASGMSFPFIISLDWQEHSATFLLWNKDVYEHYQTRLNALYAKLPHLRRNFERSIFPAAAINFGPQVCTYGHKDVQNCPFGWCVIQALGSFDPTAGGHIILWELGLIIEFPPNSTIFIPSAMVTHSNCPTGKDETRVSFTQYCAGGLLTYVDNGFRTEKEFRVEDPTGFQAMCKAKVLRWGEGLRLLPQHKNVPLKTV
jgi:hypothetical protein